MIVHQTLGDSALAGDANAIQIERIASENRVRAGAEAWASGTDRAIGQDDRRIGGIVEVGIEVAHAVVGFIGVRHTIPPQAEVQGQAPRGTPVVLYIGGPGNVVPEAAILNTKFGVDVA